jgi:hypothetical protein
MSPSVPARYSVKTRITLTMLAVFLGGLWSLAYYASQLLRKDMERLLGEQQFSSVSVLAASLNGELSERIRALDLVAHAIDGPLLADPPRLQQFLDRLIILKTIFNAGVHVVDANGAGVMGMHQAGLTGASDAVGEAMRAVLADGKTRIGRTANSPSFPSSARSMTARASTSAR